MRNFLKIFCVIALVAIIGFSMTACDDGGGDDSGGNGALGAELKIVDQQVYTETINQSSGSVTYEKFTEQKTLDSNSNYGGTGVIANGKFNFSLGTPASTYLSLVSHFFSGNGDSGYENVKVSNPEAKGLMINSFQIDSYYDDVYLAKTYKSMTISGTSYSQTAESVAYVYVDSDVTITGKGKTEQETEEDGTKFKQITKDINLTFKKGWNVVRQNMNMNATMADKTVTYTINISLGDSSSCKWVIQEDY